MSFLCLPLVPERWSNFLSGYESLDFTARVKLHTLSAQRKKKKKTHSVGHLPQILTLLYKLPAFIHSSELSGIFVVVVVVRYLDLWLSFKGDSDF